MKWTGPVVTVFLLLAGIWMIAGPYRHARLKPTPGAETLELRIGDARGIVEHLPSRTGQGPEFKVKLRDGSESETLDAAEFTQVFGKPVYDAATAERPPWTKYLFRLFNITSWTSFAWVTLGALGQTVFMGRMIVQWLHSEREKRSVVPPIFWWLSLTGGLTLSVYFVWRQEIIGFIGQCAGITVYVRNLSLIYGNKAATKG
jgi:lipid-A-disaccharide synthase-like uncharacterized protein